MCIRFLPLLSLLLLIGCASTPTAPQSELGKLQGDWQLVYEQMDGMKVPNEEAARMFHGRMNFTGDNVVYAADLPGFYFEYKCKVDATSEPGTIDLKTLRIGYKHSRDTDKYLGSTTLGIYRRNGNYLLICWNDDRRPTNFLATTENGNTLVVLKRK